jgi:hypothetical protein
MGSYHYYAYIYIRIQAVFTSKILGKLLEPLTKWEEATYGSMQR